MEEPDVKFLVFLTITISLFDSQIFNYHWIPKLVIQPRLADIVEFTMARDLNLPLSDGI